MGPASFALENGHTDDCLDTLTGLCLAGGHVGQPHESRVDAYQRIDRAIITLDTSSLEAEPSFLLLPDGGLAVNASAILIPHDGFRIVDQNLADRWRAPEPFHDRIGYRFDEEGLFVDWWLPDLPGETLLDGQNRATRRFGDDEWLAYDQVGPVNRVGGIDTETYLSSESRMACRLLTSARCPSEVAALIVAVESAVPSVRVGAELYDAGLGDPTPAAPSIGARGHAAVIGDRMLPALLSGPIPLTPPAGVGFSVGQPGLRVSASLADADRSSGRALIPPLPAQGPPEAREPIAPMLLAAAAFVLALALATLYSRMRREQILGSPARQRILRVIDASGPLRLAQLAASTGLDRTTIGYHVKLMQRAAIVEVVRREKVTYVGLAERAFTIPVATARSGREVLEAVRDRPEGIERSALHVVLDGMPPRTRNHWIGRLLASGAIVEITLPTGSVLRPRD